MARNQSGHTPGRKKAFLAAIREGATLRAAEEQTGIPRRTVFGWRKKDPKFAKAFREAHEASTDLLVAEARRRAVKGTRKPVFFKGVNCGYVREYSDTLLIFMLKARDPNTYCDKTRLARLARNWAKQDAAAGDSGATVPVAELVALMAQFAAEKAQLALAPPKETAEA